VSISSRDAVARLRSAATFMTLLTNYPYSSLRSLAPTPSFPCPAIETCPVDCIHYVSYEDLARLEVERRGQNINFKARLVSQGEGGYAQGNRVGGAVAFTGMQKITTGGRTRCNNCPTRGCKDCPMYGVGESPAFKEREEKRLKRKKEKDMEKERLKEQKRADL